MTEWERKRDEWVRSMQIVTDAMIFTQKMNPEGFEQITRIMGPAFAEQVRKADEAYEASHPKPEGPKTLMETL